MCAGLRLCNVVRRLWVRVPPGARQAGQAGITDSMTGNEKPVDGGADRVIRITGSRISGRRFAWSLWSP